MALRNLDYIGDGVYVSWDGFYIWLRTERETGTHEIAIDPRMLEKLKNYAKARYAEVNGADSE
jgi:NADPH-dependent 7-cyano-7-deazaguanine reductase QueF